MILTCPNCSTRYLAKPETIGENGRTVRCSKCSNTWFVAATPDALDLEDQIKPEIERLAADDGLTQDGDSKSELSRRQDDLREAQRAATQGAAMGGAHVAFRDKADAKRRHRRMFGVTMIWVTTLGLLALAALLAFLFRQPIVERFPQTAALYQAFSVEATSTGLLLNEPQTEYIRIEGEPRLVVNGRVQNLTKSNKQIPLVKLSILNRNDEEITHWFVQPSPDKISPRSYIEFAAEYPNPPLDAASLSYEFILEKG